MSTTFSAKTYFEKSEEENEKMKMKIFNFFIIYVVWIKVVPAVNSPNLDHYKYTDDCQHNYFRKTINFSAYDLHEKKSVFRRFCVQLGYRIFDRSSKIIMLMGNHLYICNGQRLRKPPIPLLPIQHKIITKLKILNFIFSIFFLLHFFSK